LDNEYASQFEFRASDGPYVHMIEVRQGQDVGLRATFQYSRSGRVMLDGLPGKPGDPDPHMQIIADKLNEAVEPLNKVLRRV